MDATIVFDKNWKAITERNENGLPKYKYIINEGSSRSSKTHSLLQCFYLYAFINYNKRLTVWRDTKKDCRDTILNDMLKSYRKLEDYHKLTFHKVEAIFTFPTLSTIEIHGTDDEEKVMGLNKDVCWINEPYKISKETFDQLDMRTSDFVIIDWNPKKSHWIEDLKKDPRAITIHSTFKDNPFCPDEQRHKILSYQPVKLSEVVVSNIISESYARQYDMAVNPLRFTEKQLKELTRCINNEEKNSANEFNWQVYGLGLKAEKPNRIFRWYKIPDHEYHALKAVKYYGVDWGAVDAMGILEAKYYDGALYLHELNYLSENQIRENLTPAQLSQIQATEEGLIMWYFNKLGIDKNSVCVCDSNRPLKIRALRTAGFDYSIAAVKGAGSIIDGIDLLNGMKVYYTESSTNIAYEQENYSRKVDRYGIILDEPEDFDNHLMDPARYVAEFLRSQGIIKNI